MNRRTDSAFLLGESGQRLPQGIALDVDLQASLEHVANYNVTAKEIGEDVIFLYQLTRGAASRSFGVAVAKLAELPAAVISRAKTVLSQLESQISTIDHLNTGHGSVEPREQLDLFQARTVVESQAMVLLAELQRLSIDQLTPIEALTLLDTWKKRLKSAG